MTFRDPAKDLKVKTYNCPICASFHADASAYVLEHVGREHKEKYQRLVREENLRLYPYDDWRGVAAVLSCNHLAMVYQYRQAYTDSICRWGRTDKEPPDGTVDRLTDAVVFCEVCDKPRQAIKFA